ncbi:MAG: CoA transferase [Dehalococcoidia bacterium]|nr:CoA transferase [Dehalococcoidia bacterium]
MSKKALAGVRVLEYAQFVAGPYCGKLLADLGAEVIKIEEPEIGDEARRRGPFLHDVPDPEYSALFLYLNTNKLGITLNLKSATGIDMLKDLIADADILIEDKPLQMMREFGLNFGILEAINPRLVMTSITPFGQTGPYAEYKAYPLNTAHSAQLAYLTPYGSPYPDREPLKLGGMSGEHICGLTAATGTLAALHARRITGLGQHVDVSKQEAMLDMARMWAVQYPNDRVSASRMQNMSGMSILVPCTNGHVVVSLHEIHHWRAIVQIMGNPEWSQNKLYDDSRERMMRFQTEIGPHIAEWVKNQTKEELYRAGQEANCPITPVMSAEDVANSEQYKARGFFVEVEHTTGQKITLAGAPYRFSKTPWTIERSAPLLGQHNGLIGCWRETRTEQRLGEVRRKGKKRTVKYPLEGVRIADFGFAWAGPQAVGLLARMGAEVIKVESHTRIDHSRILSLTTGTVFGEIDRSLVFGDLNMNKLGITLNLGHPKGVELAKELIKISDVVAQNMRPGVMDRLGLGYEALREINPNIIMLSLSALGMTGPQRNYIGYAPAFGALSGLSYITGYADHSPAILLGEMDLLSGTTGAFAILAALVHKQQTGEGQHIDLSCTEAISVLIGDVLMDYTMNGRIQFRKGNQDEYMAPHNCYRCKGDDKWISIAVATDEEWGAFCKVVGHPEWTHDSRYADALSRWQNQKELDKLVSIWTLKHTHFEAMEMLQRAGVAAVPSFNSEDLYHNPHLRERNYWIEIDHPLVGKQTVAAPPWRLSRTPARITRHGPLLGEHNDYVFGELLGLSKSEIVSLVEERVIY